MNKKSAVPPYVQIVQQVRQAIMMGSLRKGDQLPTVKEAVRMMVVNPNTVVKAYRELEQEGLVQGRIGSGTFVADRPRGPSIKAQAELAAMARVWIKQARQAGFDAEAIEAVVRGVLYDNKEGSHE